MSREIYVVGDTHFNQTNILGFVNFDGSRVREFSSTEEMNEHMIQKWNSVVREQDHVWHLGDLTMGSYDDFETNILPRLKGKINLIVGNHDNIPRLCAIKRIKKIAMQRRFDDMGLYLTHIPIHKSSLWNHRLDKPMLNVHGHIHCNHVPEEGYKNVSVEVIDYTPVNIETLRIW